MSNELPALEWIEPPSGGTRALHDRIARRTRRRFITVGCAFVVLTAGMLLQNTLNVPGQAQPVEDIIARDAANRASTRPPLRVADGAALELPSPSSNARIYLVSTVPDEPLPESG